MTTGAPQYDVVIPTVGRPSLETLLDSLVRAGVDPDRVVVVDDSTARSGPAAARNRGVEALGPDRGGWVVFLDDDVVVGPGWLDALAADLRDQPPDVGAVQGRVSVPLPQHRRPTDWERHTARLEHARWITADLAVRRHAFDALGGFDPTFRRAFREDSDFALRMSDAGWRLAVGERATTHPVRRAGPWASLRVQAGNQEHARMRLRHGRSYRQRLGEGRTAWPLEVAAVTAGSFAAAALLGRRRASAAAGALAWAVATTAFTASRVRPGPRTPDEVARMTVTSVLIPPAAVGHRLLGWWRAIRDVRR